MQYLIQPWSFQLEILVQIQKNDTNCSWYNNLIFVWLENKSGPENNIAPPKSLNGRSLILLMLSKDFPTTDPYQIQREI